MKNLWGIDLGGTKTEGVIIESVENPKIIHRLRIPTESYKGYDHIISMVSTLVEMISSETGLKPDKIGIGTSGTVDPQLKSMKNCNTTCLNGMPFNQDLEKALSVSVVIANDANCLALAESRIGAVADILPGAEIVFGVILGTGVGGGIVVNAKVLNGLQGIAGEWGHNFLDESGGLCYCGKVGCVETVISGPALQSYYRSLGGNLIPLTEIVKRHREGMDKKATVSIPFF